MKATARLMPSTAPARRWITALALLAFFLQGLTLQTHVHQPLLPVAAKLQTDSAPKAPLKLDPMDQCRLCQELVHAGTFINPSAAVTAAELTLETVVAIRDKVISAYQDIIKMPI